MNILYLHNLNQVRDSLNVWLSNVEQLHFGNQSFTFTNDLDRKNTKFSKWYFNEGQNFKQFESFATLLFFYNEMYDEFIEYVQLKNSPIKKSFFSNSKQKRQDELNLIFQKIKKNGRKLIKSFELFEEEIKSSMQFENYNPPNWFQIDNIEILDAEFIIPDLSKKEVSDNLPFDFEKRLQEEVLKIKKQLELEFEEKLELLKNQNKLDK